MRRLVSLRKQVLFLEVKRALSRTARTWFRVVHFSVQADHVHLLVEADDKSCLARGLMGAEIRIARAVNRALSRRGPLWGDRYHARPLRTPREVRHALVYVLMNWKKHLPSATGFDPCSTARWFKDWKVPLDEPPEIGPVEAPETWLLRVGWKRHGLIAERESPKATL